MTMHEEFTDRLSDYLDGELTGDENAAVEAHLRECAACVAVLNDLKRVVAHARTLEARPPEADLWPGIAARHRRSAVPARVSLTIAQLAAAAVVLVALSSAVAVRLAGPLREATPAPQAAADAATAAPLDASTVVSVAPVSFGEAQYDAAVADLEKALRAGRGRLDKSTIDIVEHNLQIIDHAIAQARDALAADPANTYLSNHLIEARRRKLDLLRRAAALADSN